MFRMGRTTLPEMPCEGPQMHFSCFLSSRIGVKHASMPMKEGQYACKPKMLCPMHATAAKLHEPAPPFSHPRP